MIEVLVDGNWIEQDPVNGDQVRYTVGEGEYQHYLETTYVLISEEETAKIWRNTELDKSDWIVPITDHPQHAAYLTYRQALRDWPSTSSFPGTKPTL